jgi:PRC-barrel domain
MKSFDKGTPFLEHVRDAAAIALVPLSAASGLAVADGEPDIRGWRVRTRTGSEIGEVTDLIVDPARMQVRYMDVRLERAFAGDGRHVLVPIGVAALDETQEDVHVDTGAASLLNAPAYTPRALSRSYERAVLENFGWRGATSGADRADEFYGGAHFDERSCFGSRGESGRPYIASAGGRA